MKTLNFAKDLSFPIELAGQATCIFGIRGSGKTNTAGVLAEELLDQHHPIVVIDPTDAWWGLASDYQVFIFGGSHAHVPLAETDGKVLAEFLVREQVPAILSLRHLRKGAQRRFVTEFCEEIYHLKGKDKNRTPLTVFIDEAPLFVPQKVMGEVARTVGAVEDLIARGRNAGFGVVLISQRSATINADVRTQADTIICHRVTAPLDRKAISDWFEENATAPDLKAILSSLATLKNGEAWVWSPGLDIMKRAQIRMRRTFDSSATPKPGQKVPAPRKLTDVDLTKLKGQLAATIEKAKADDPRTLRARIAELEKAAANGPVAIAPVAPIVERVEVAVIDGAHLAELGFLADKMTALLVEVTAAIRNGQTINAHQKEKAAVAFSRPIVLAKTRTPSVRPTSNGDVKLGRCEMALLSVLAQRTPDTTSRSQLSILSEYSKNSSSFTNAIGKLRSAGLIDGASDAVVATSEGLATAGDVEPMPTGKALVARWQSQLGKCEATLLGVLVEAYPTELHKDTIAERSGYSATSSSFTNAIGKLRTLELVKGTRASEVFFQ